MLHLTFTLRLAYSLVTSHLLYARLPMQAPGWSVITSAHGIQCQSGISIELLILNNSKINQLHFSFIDYCYCIYRNLFFFYFCFDILAPQVQKKKTDANPDRLRISNTFSLPHFWHILKFSLKSIRKSLGSEHGNRICLPVTYKMRSQPNMPLRTMLEKKDFYWQVTSWQ